MLVTTNNPFEFRGVSTRATDKGTYHYANFENEDGNPMQVYVGKSSDMVSDLEKGDMCLLTFDYNQYYKSMNLKAVEMVG